MVHDLQHIKKSLPAERQTSSDAPASLPDSPTSPICQKCNDIGFVYPLKDEKIDWSRIVPCVCQAERIQQEARARMLKYCELPEHSEDLTFATFDTGNYPTLKNGLRAAKALLPGSDKLRWLTLTGGRDLGKTHLAVAVCREWIARGTPAKYVFVPILLDWLRESFDKPDAFLADRMRILSEVPLLVLDDLGVENSTPWAKERLITIIDSRYVNHRSLMVATNKDIEDLPGDDEGRIASRLKRFVPGKMILMEAPEYFERRSK
jgi:DNA replication protein DnaC